MQAQKRHPYVWAIHPYGDLRHRTVRVTHRVLTGSHFLGVHSRFFTTNEEHRWAPSALRWTAAAGLQRPPARTGVS
jgi:hypothetical protein